MDEQSTKKRCVTIGRYWLLSESPENNREANAQQSTG
jgi:hypothetical protein